MNYKKSDYFTIVMFGELDDFKNKMLDLNQEITDVINIIDVNGMSLLQKSLITRKFKFSNYFLEHNCNVNVITKESRNELHYLSANINENGALQIAEELVTRGVDLLLKDNEYGSPAILTLCIDILKKRYMDRIQFLKKCIKDLDNAKIKNDAGVTLESLVLKL